MWSVRKRFISVLINLQQIWNQWGKKQHNVLHLFAMSSLYLPVFRSPFILAFTANSRKRKHFTWVQVNNIRHTLSSNHKKCVSKWPPESHGEKKPFYHKFLIVFLSLCIEYNVCDVSPDVFFNIESKVQTQFRDHLQSIAETPINETEDGPCNLASSSTKSSLKSRDRSPANCFSVAWKLLR